MTCAVCEWTMLVVCQQMCSSELILMSIYAAESLTNNFLHVGLRQLCIEVVYAHQDQLAGFCNEPLQYEQTVHTHHVGCTSANQARLDLDLPSYVPGGSELGGDDMCSVCMDHVS